jgi:hypothetical protein
MSFDDDFDGPEPYEDDLQTFSDNQAWEDAQADMAEEEEPLRASITLSAAELAEAGRLLALTDRMEHPKDGLDVLMSWTAQFEDGCQVDLKVVNAADGPYLDVVLFDQDGCEIGLEEGDAPILGEHAFSGYTLTVEGEAE